MAKEITTISPEGLEVANSYLQFGNIRAVVETLGVPEYTVAEILNKREVKTVILCFTSGYQTIKVDVSVLFQSKSSSSGFDPDLIFYLIG